MLEFRTTNRFDKDLKKKLKSGKDKEKIVTVMTMIINQIPLGVGYKDHKLKGEWKDCRECHIEPDWLLIYRFEKDMVTFERNGTHAELFE
ncbi:MAG: type II toxin-antitoxin system YafQ family toxin [bacterium]|nr:type II toxin-antitoxin system YafQ family toxin [bacterium]